MFEAIVLVPMRVRLAYWIIRPMLMLVMLVMNVRVRVRHCIVHVFMLMAVHHLSGSKATMIVFVPILLLVVLLVTFTLTFVGGLLLFCLLAAYLSLLWEIS